MSLRNCDFLQCFSRLEPARQGHMMSLELERHAMPRAIFGSPHKRLTPWGLSRQLVLFFNQSDYPGMQTHGIQKCDF
jgi:hypothetical protein